MLGWLVPSPVIASGNWTAYRQSLHPCKNSFAKYCKLAMSTSNATTVIASTTTVQTATTTTVATTHPNPRLSVVGASSSRVGISPLETAFAAAFQGAIPQQFPPPCEGSQLHLQPYHRQQLQLQFLPLYKGWG